jgi:hypothetical protein
MTSSSSLKRRIRRRAIQLLATLGAMLTHRSIPAKDNAGSDSLRSRKAMTQDRFSVIQGPVKWVLV